LNPSKSLIAIFFLILFISCEKDANLHISDYQYFPLSVGQYQIYEVTEALYSISNEPIHSKYFLKEQISESYENPASEKVYKIERLKRQTNAEPWKIDSVWTTQLLTNKAIRTENNINIVKLYFPIQTAQFWNKNEFNNYRAQKISYQDKGKDFRIDTKVYQNTVSVIIKNDSSLLSKNKYFEVYAPLFGMIYRENISLAYCQSTPACIGKGLIEYGSEQKIKLIEMGQDK
jgi:hypothetical protein